MNNTNLDPDIIDMMTENELRKELRKILIENERLKNGLNEIIKLRESFPYYATGVRVDPNLIAKLCDQMYNLAQKALEEK